jgi:DNA-binding NarL/FixJ family response regulator
MIQQKIMVADDHPILRRVIGLILLKHFGIKEVAEVSTCAELMKRLAESKFTHLVLDINLGDGSSLETLPVIRKCYPDLRIMIFSMFTRQTYEQRLSEYGIHFYLEKSASEEVSLQTFQQFLLEGKPSGKFFYNNPFVSLSSRELEVLHYMMHAMSTKEIAEIMGLRLNTISTFKTRIYDKTMTSNFRELRDLVHLYNHDYGR